jgi:hypothetical protein
MHQDISLSHKRRRKSAGSDDTDTTTKKEPKNKPLIKVSFFSCFAEKQNKKL